MSAVAPASATLRSFADLPLMLTAAAVADTRLSAAARRSRYCAPSHSRSAAAIVGSSDE